MASIISARKIHLLIVSFIAFLICSCTTAPQYDAKADTDIGNLQSKLHLRINNWISGSKPVTWSNDNISFYDDIDNMLKSLEIRMEATPDPSTANLPIVFSNLSAEITSLKTLHMQQGKLSEAYLRAKQQQLDAQFAALFTYELSLKTAATGGGGATQSTATSQNPGKQPMQN